MHEGRHGPLIPSTDPIMRMVTVGDSGVGKTSLLRRFAKDQFSPSFITTIGIDFQVKHIRLDSDGSAYRLQIWDTAGQERFRTITNAYYRGAAAVVLVYDVTDKQSFANLGEWMLRIQEQTQDLPRAPLLALVGNKCDLAEKRAVGETEGKALAASRGYLFCETSALTASGVTKLFMDLAERVHARAKEVEAQSEVVTVDVVKLEDHPEAHQTRTKKSCC